MRLDVGDIFTWENFPYPITGEIKRRWFIYFGDGGYFSIDVYLFTTTTNMDRNNEDSIIFHKGEYSFTRDCILNVGQNHYSKNITKVDIDKHIKNGNINKVSKLQENKIREIYNKVLKSKYISRIDKIAIHDALNRAGIINLTKPKK